MPRPSRSIFTMPMSAQSSLSHCTTTRPGHAGVLERHDAVQAPLADHHAARMLPEMARQVLDPLPQLREQPHARGRRIDAHRVEVRGQRLVPVLRAPLEVGHHLREPVDLLRLDAERLPHFPRRAAAAIGDHVGGHRRAVLAVLLVDVLDDALAPVAARQIEIDVRPLAALLGQEPLEQQVHPHRIHRRDAQAVADGAVGRRPAALHENPLLPAEIDDVPDDQEVAGERELLDQIQLARNLRARAVVIRPIPLARADLRHLPQERRHRLARGHRVVGEAIAEVGHRVAKPIGERRRAGHRLRDVAKELRHLLARLEEALGVQRQLPPGRLERRLVADAGEHVVERAILRRREAHAVGGHHRDVKRGRQRDQRLVVGLLVPDEMPLQLQVDVRPAEQADQAIHQAAHAVAPAAQRLAPDERHHPGGVAVQLVERQRPLALRRPEVHARQQAAEVLVALAGFDEEGEAEAGSWQLAAGSGRRMAGSGSWRLAADTDGWRLQLPLQLTAIAAHCPLSIVTSAPTIGRIPAARAALWKRGAPCTPLRSRSATAG